MVNTTKGWQWILWINAISRDLSVISVLEATVHHRTPPRLQRSMINSCICKETAGNRGQNLRTRCWRGRKLTRRGRNKMAATLQEQYLKYSFSCRNFYVLIIRAVRDYPICPFASIGECLVSYLCLDWERKFGQRDQIPVKCELNISCNLVSIHTYYPSWNIKKHMDNKTKINRVSRGTISESLTSMEKDITYLWNVRVENDRKREYRQQG